MTEIKNNDSSFALSQHGNFHCWVFVCLFLFVFLIVDVIWIFTYKGDLPRGQFVFHTPTLIEAVEAWKILGNLVWSQYKMPYLNISFCHGHGKSEWNHVYQTLVVFLLKLLCNLNSLSSDINKLQQKRSNLVKVTQKPPSTTLTCNQVF